MREIVGLMSTYREGRLSVEAAASLCDACDRVFVLEGKIGDMPEYGEPSQFPSHRRCPNLVVRHATREYGSDAAKRTALVHWAQSKIRGEAWAVILDGDEILWAPPLLADVLWRSEHENDIGGVTLRVIEAGDHPIVHESGARCLPLHAIDRYIMSGYVIKLRGMSVPISLPLVPSDRPPAMHEPHIVHRAYLRPPERNERAQRLSTHELTELREMGVKI